MRPDAPPAAPAPAVLPPSAASPARGAALMLAGCALLTVNDAIMKELVTALPLGELVALRAAAGVVCTLAIAPFLGGGVQVVPRHPGPVLVIAAMLVVTLFLFPLSLRYVPLADAVLLAYLSPLVVTALSPWLLAEPVGWRRWGAVGLGLAGAVLVLEPGGGMHPAVAAPLAVAVIVGVRDVLTRRWIRGERPLALVLASQGLAIVAGLATLPFGWVMPGLAEAGLILAAAVLITVSQAMILVAFSHADAAVMSCLKYSSIVWAALLGWLVWNEVPGLNDLAGAALIAASGVIILRRSARRRS